MMRKGFTLGRSDKSVKTACWIGEKEMSALRKRWILVAALALIAVASIGILYEVAQLQTGGAPQEKTLYQLSPFNTFSLGNFEGNTTFADLSKHGNFGIGTLNGLNGEMIALSGNFYQIPSTGIPRQINPDEKTPYATITFFNPSQTIQITAAMNYSQLTSFINASLPSYNAIYAIEVHGDFDYAKTRSPAMQAKPYPNLTQALTTQVVFNLNNVTGTAVGFYFPISMDGVDFAGYHLHFLSDDKTAGGHLLDCTIASATIEIERINSYNLAIP